MTTHLSPYVILTLVIIYSTKMIKGAHKMTGIKRGSRCGGARVYNSRDRGSEETVGMGIVRWRGR